MTRLHIFLAILVLFIGAPGLTQGQASAPARVSATDADYLQRIAIALDELAAGHVASAVQPLDASMNLRRDERLAYLVRGIVFLHAGDYTEARKAFLAARDMLAEPELVSLGLALSALGSGDLTAAASLLPAPGGRIDAADIRFIRTYIALLETGKASTDSLPAQDARVGLLRAYTLLRDGNTSEALPLLSAFPAADPLSPDLDRGVSMSFDRSRPLLAPGVPQDAANRAPKGPYTGLSGAVQLKTDLSQTPDVAYVLYFVNDQLIGIVNTRPFEIVWDTSQFPNGIHTLRIRGENHLGSLVGESSQQVMVTNRPPEPGTPIQGAAADRLLQAATNLLRLQGSRTWAEYQLSTHAEQSGNTQRALQGYARILAFRPEYRDVQQRWRQAFRKVGSRPIWKGTGSDGSLALTFDDGPNQGTDELLEALTRHNLKATFFLVGMQVRAMPEVVQDIARRGHELAAHSETHRALTQMNDREIIRELFGPVSAIMDAAGVIPRHFRPPGGHLDTRGRQLAEQFGFFPVMWSVHCGPYEGGSVAGMEEYLAANLKAGDIVLMHNCEPTTLKAIPFLANRVKTKGLKPVGISSLNR